MRYVGIRIAQSVAICVKGYIFVLREKEIDTRDIERDDINAFASSSSHPSIIQHLKPRGHKREVRAALLKSAPRLLSASKQV
jgi:hypothetical protein